MQRRDVAVFSISTALAAIVVAALTYSVVVLDRSPRSAVIESDATRSSWFVVTWGPTLCQVEPSNLGCASGHVGDMGQTMVLHGLWPQPSTNQYCGVPKEVADRSRKIHGSDIPPVELSEDVRNNLRPIMSDVAVMAPHEWYAHGTCAGVTPDEYFGDATKLTDQARSILDPVFREAEGKHLTLSAVRNKFDAAFGEGAGERVGLSCRNVTGEGSVIYEVQMSLPPVVDLNTTDDAASLGDLLLKGPPISPECRHGRVP
jgi:ribonuclease T2